MHAEASRRKQRTQQDATDQRSHTQMPRTTPREPAGQQAAQHSVRTDPASGPQGAQTVGSECLPSGDRDHAHDRCACACAAPLTAHAHHTHPGRSRVHTHASVQTGAQARLNPCNTTSARLTHLLVNSEKPYAASTPTPNRSAAAETTAGAAGASAGGAGAGAAAGAASGAATGAGSGSTAWGTTGAAAGEATVAAVAAGTPAGVAFFTRSMICLIRVTSLT